MASKRLLDKRREAEAAEKLGKTSKSSTAKKSTRKTTTRKRKTKAPERKRLLWGVFSGTLKEEGRFLWNERDKAEEKLEQLRSKSKKLYFIQPIKEVLSDAPPVADEVIPSDDTDEGLDEEAMMDDDSDDDDDGEEE